MPEPPPGPIELSRSGIRIEGDTLIKTDQTGEVVGRLRLEGIREVNMAPGRSWKWIPALLLLLCVDGVFFVLEAGWLGLSAWLLVYLCVLAVALPFSRRTEVRVMSGPAEVRWTIRDPPGEGEAFVAILRSIIERRRTGAGTGA